MVVASVIPDFDLSTHLSGQNMAATVTFHYLGPPEQKHVAKVGPMAHLRAALTEAAAKWRPPVDPATAQVLLNKKPVNLDTPFRLLNIPSGSRLDVVRGALCMSMWTA